MADAAAPNPDRSRVREASSMSSVDCYLQLASPSPSSSPSSSAPSPTPAVARGHALEEPPKRRRPARRSKPVRMFQSMCRSLPVLTVPRCGRLLLPLPTQAAGTASATASPARLSSSDSFLSHLISPTGGTAGTSSSHKRMTGTLFGYRDGRVALALQENPRCRPALVVEFALQTHVLLREIGTTAGARIVLECEKKPAAEDHEEGGSGARHDDDDGGAWLLEEPIWTMFCNGKRVGYAVRREPMDADVAVLETLWAVSMGGGVLPGRAGADAPDGEMAYMRGCFEHVVGSGDSESLYMLGPHGGDCPELAVFFVRL